MRITDPPPNIEGKRPRVSFLGGGQVDFVWIRMVDHGIFALSAKDTITFHPWHTIDAIEFMSKS